MCNLIDTNPAAESLAEILFQIIDLGETGPVLYDDAKEVELLFCRINMGFADLVIKKLGEKRREFYVREEPSDHLAEFKNVMDAAHVAYNPGDDK
jgi:hypothetical protein